MKQIPHGLRPYAFVTEYRRLVAEDYERQPDRSYRCQACGTPAETGTAYVSIHDTRFSGCAGGGEVEQVRIPGCPRCEPEGHTMHACVHLDPEEAMHGLSIASMCTLPD